MKEFSVSLKEKLHRLDYIIIICAVGMTALSIITLAGAANEYGNKLVTVQTLASLMGIAVMLIIASLDYDKIIRQWGKWFLPAAIVFMLAVLVFGKEKYGNRNWIEIPGVPFNIQPSEYCKFLFIVSFAQHIKLVQGEINKIKNVIKLAVHAGILCGLILLTGDLGSTLVYFFIIAAMLLVGGLSVWYFIAAAAVLVLASPLLWEFLSTKQQNRIIYGFWPEGDPADIGYQALRSRVAIAAGGFLGSGFAGGSQFALIPFGYNDFLFAVLAEKFGFFGCFAYIALMAVMIIRILWIARIARKDYGAYMCTGVAAVFIAQTLENIGMCLAMLPVIGITLPFMSYGGSSMLSMYMLVGLVQSVKSHNRKYFFERENA